MAADTDYASLMPGSLASDYDALTAAYKENVKLFDDAIKTVILPGTKFVGPDFIKAKKIITDASTNFLPSAREVLSYAGMIKDVAPLVDDKKELVDTLLPIVGAWTYADLSTLTSDNDTYEAIFSEYLPKLDTILAGLAKFVQDLLASDPANPPDFYSKTLFEILSSLLAPLATFPSGTEGEKLLATLLGVSQELVSTTLKELFTPPPVKHKHTVPPPPPPPPPIITPAIIADIIQKKLIDVLTKFRELVNSFVGKFAKYSALIKAADASQRSVAARLQDGDNGGATASEQDALNAWAAVEKAVQAFIDAVTK